MSTAIIIGLAASLLAALTAIVMLVRTNSKCIADSDEAFKKVLVTVQDDGKLRLDLAQVTANRDLLNNTINDLKNQIVHTQNALAVTEGQRDDLIKELDKVDTNGNALASAVKRELRALQKLSTAVGSGGKGS